MSLACIKYSLAETAVFVCLGPHCQGESRGLWVSVVATGIINNIACKFSDSSPGPLVELTGA